MKIAIFSDVHGNLSALEAVLASIESQSDIDKVIFAGDFGVFGPRPSECLQRLRRQPIQAIVGNTDEWILDPPPIVAGLEDKEKERRLHLQAICNWTKEQLDEESIEWVKQIRQSFSITINPDDDKEDDLLIVHANPVDLAQIIFPSEQKQTEIYGRVRQTDADLNALIGLVGAGSIVFGHLHIPGIREWRGRRLVNISSVSLPGDGDSRAKYAILSWELEAGWQVEYVKIPYPIEEEIDAFTNARPPGWQKSIELLEDKGFVPQVV